MNLYAVGWVNDAAREECGMRDLSDVIYWMY